MTVTGLDQIMCENRNTELLLEEIYRINPCTKFNILGSIISETEALMLYYSVMETYRNNSYECEDMVYIPIFNLKS